jgi:hypothetical protein
MAAEPGSASGLVRVTATLAGIGLIAGGCVAAAAGVTAPTSSDKIAYWALALALLPAAAAAFRAGLGPDWPNRMHHGLVDWTRRHPGYVFLAMLLASIGVLQSDGHPAHRIVSANAVALVTDMTGPALVFNTPSDGGVRYCSRKDEAWTSRWFGPSAPSGWPPLDSMTAFGSRYSGIEVIGRANTTLVFGYRDGSLQWHALQPIDKGVAGQPAALDFDKNDRYRFLVFVPDETRGVRVYERPDYEPGWWPPGWHLRAVIGASLGRADAAAAIENRRGDIILVIRSGAKLYSVVRTAEHTDKFDVGWSEPSELAIGADQSAATGNPAAALSGEISATSQLQIAVPTSDWITILTADAGGRSWRTESLRVGTHVDAVAVASGSHQGNDTLEIAFLSRGVMFHFWKEGPSPWRGPTPIQCGP